MSSPVASHHGVMMSITGIGIFIQGRPGLGKSSIALDLIQRGHQLIADDITDFYTANQDLLAQVPAELAGKLHCRELGPIDVTRIFGPQAWQHQHRLDLIVRLEPVASGPQLYDPQTTEKLAGYTLPCWHLTLDNPVPVSQRIELLARLFPAT